MGASQPKQIQVTVNVNKDPNNITNSVNKDNDNVAPPPISPFTANVQAKGENGKEIPCNIVLNQNSINNYEQNSTNPSDLSESNTSNNNIDNNMPRNRDKNNQTKNPQKNDFSIFNKENSAEINKINDDKEIDKNIDVNKIKEEDKKKDNKNSINEKKDDKNKNKINSINDKKDDKNNFLKEGVREVTKFGDEEKEEEKNDNNQTPVGENIDMNIPRNKYEKNNELLINNKTPIGDNDNDGNIDMNIGGAFKQKKENQQDSYNGLNFSDGDLSLSQSAFVSESQSLEHSMQWIQKGYHPIFMRLKNYNPVLLHIKEDATLMSLVRAYFKHYHETDEGIMKDLKLYFNKEELDINTPIKFLKLGLFSIITDRKEDNNTNK